MLVSSLAGVVVREAYISRPTPDLGEYFSYGGFAANDLLFSLADRKCVHVRMRIEVVGEIESPGNPTPQDRQASITELVHVFLNHEASRRDAASGERVQDRAIYFFRFRSSGRIRNAISNWQIIECNCDSGSGTWLGCRRRVLRCECRAASQQKSDSEWFNHLEAAT